MRSRRSLLAATMVGLTLTACDGKGADQQTGAGAWSVDSVPSLVIASGGANDSVTLAMITGATRLPGGDILVGDPGDYGLLRFGPDGHLAQRIGRKGAGPGEIDYLARLDRCGDSLFIKDIGNRRTSVFNVNGEFVRAFIFGMGERTPYRSVCNRQGTFVHYGWEDRRQIVEGRYRQDVPFWFSSSDSSTVAFIGDYPGSERIGYVSDGRIAGAGPLPLGKQTAVAIGSDRAYIGTADRYEFLVVDLSGAVVDTLRRDRPPQKTTAADIAFAKSIEKAGVDPRRAAAIDDLWSRMPFPATLPAYADALVDARDLLWVQDFVRSGSPLIDWTVFDKTGKIVASLSLPAYLEAYEIGEDYVLGRFLDPAASEPEVRLYRLHRSDQPK